MLTVVLLLAAFVLFLVGAITRDVRWGFAGLACWVLPALINAADAAF